MEALVVDSSAGNRSQLALTCLAAIWSNGVSGRRIGEADIPGPVNLPVVDTDPDTELDAMLAAHATAQATPPKGDFYRGAVGRAHITVAAHTEDFVDFNLFTPHLAVAHFNVTEWGDEVEGFVCNTQYNVVCISEHHLLDTSAVALRMRAAGWTGVWHPAVRSEADLRRVPGTRRKRGPGSSGGTAILWTSYFAVEPP